MPINYQLGKIYKIVDNTTDKCYIGSTTEPTLARRLAGHVADYKSYLKGKGFYVSSFEILKNGDYEILLVESFPCESKDQLHARERHWTKAIECINKIKNQGLKNEIGKVAYQKEYDKIYREQNADKITERDGQKHICECGGKYTHQNKSLHLKTKKHISFIKESI